MPEEDMSNIETITDKGHTGKLNEEDGGTILTSHQIVLYIHQERVKLVIVRQLALLPCVALIAHHRLG